MILILNVFETIESTTKFERELEDNSTLNEFERELNDNPSLNKLRCEVNEF